MNASFDITKRNLRFNQKPLILTFVSSLVSDNLINEVIKGLNNSENKTIEQAIINGSVSKTNNQEQMISFLLSGNCILEYDGIYYIIEVKNYPSRGIQEPETEKTVRGSKDGFVENIITNVGLIRRRINDQNLMMKMLQVGKISKCNVCVSYLENKVNQKLLDLIVERLNQIEIDDLSMSDRALEEVFIHQGYHPFPLVRYCERPDITATHIMSGHIAIIVDTSSSAILIPLSLFDLMAHVEEHRQPPIIGSALRLIRTFAIFISIYFIPIWIMMLQIPNLERLILKSPISDYQFTNIIFEIVLLELSFEILRVATIHTPSALSNAIGLVSAILLGQLAVDIGIFLPEVLLYGSIAVLSGFATPNYELSLANKLVKWFLIIGVILFGGYGFVVANFLLIMYLMHLKVFNQYYLYPLIPFNDELFFDYVIRKPKRETY